MCWAKYFWSSKIPSGAKQPSRKLTYKKEFRLFWFRSTRCRPTFFKAYGLVTIIVSQYALQPHDCRGQPYWKAKYIVRP